MSLYNRTMQSELNILLYEACECGDFAEISNLLADGADPNALTDSGYAPLHNAIFRSKPEGARLLLAHGAKPNIQTIHEGLYPAHFAIGRGAADDNLFLRLLLDAGALPHAVDRNGMSLACYTAREGCVASLEMLAKYGADILATDFSGATPLSFATFHRRIPCLRFLLKAGANPNVQQADGHTPATLAIRLDHLDCLKLLVEAGARLDVAPRKFSALALAEKHARSDLIEYVRAHCESQKLDALLPESNGSNPKIRL